MFCHYRILNLTFVIESSFFKEKSDFVSTCHKVVISKLIKKNDKYHKTFNS